MRQQGKFTTTVCRKATFSVLTVSDHSTTKVVWFMHWYIDVSGFAGIG